MALTTIPVGLVRVAWVGPTLTLANATWKANLDAVYRENTARSTLVSFKPQSGVNAVTTVNQGEFYIFKVKTQFQLDDTLAVLSVPAGAAVPAPTISSFSPTSGPTGTAITITGTNLSNPYWVGVGGVKATVQANSATSITATIASITPTGFVQVITAGGPVTSTTPFTVSTANLGVARVAMFVGQSNDSGLSPRTGLASQYFNTDTRIRSWDQTSGTALTYSLGAINTSTNAPYTYAEAQTASNISLFANDHGISKLIVPSYDNGFGPDVAWAYAYKQDSANAGKEIFFFKKDLTPPVSTDGSSIQAWLYGVDGRDPLYTGFYNEWQAFRSYLLSIGYTGVQVDFWVCGIGEQDAQNYLGNSSGGPNPNFAGSLTAFYQRFLTDGIVNAQTRIVIHPKQQTYTISSGITAAQQLFVTQKDNAVAATLPAAQFLGDNTHYSQAGMLALGAASYAAAKAPLVPSITAATSVQVGQASTLTGTMFKQGMTVSFAGGVTATATVTTSTTATVVVPAGATSGNISVTTNNGTSNTYSYVVAVAPGGGGVTPTITSFTPTSVGTSDNQPHTVTVTGTNLGGITAVRVGTQNISSFTQISNTQFSFVVTRGITSGYIIATCTAGTATSATAISIGDVVAADLAPIADEVFTPLGSTISYNSSTKKYSTSNTSANWLEGGLSSHKLPTGVVGGVSMFYNGVDDEALLGFSTSNAFDNSASYAMTFGLYFEALPDGGHGIRTISGTSVNPNLMTRTDNSPLVCIPNAHYMPYRYNEAGTNLKKWALYESVDDGQIWNAVAFFELSLTGALYPQFKITGRATSALVNPRVYGNVVAA